jgi:glycosyltransferase involved in cell wall biosynthesis
VNVAFIVNDLQLSGGIGVVVTHARELAAHHGMDVTLVLAREQEVPHWEYEDLDQLHAISLAEARERHFDVAVGTFWVTVLSLFEIPADRYAFFVQSLEDRSYRANDPERFGAAITLSLPVAFITEATWIRDTLAELRPDAPCHLVRNGIDKDVFATPDAVEPNSDGPLRILVEGYASSWFKGVNDAIAATRAMAEPHELTVVAANRDSLDAKGATRVVGPISQRDLADLYAHTDVVLKLSRVEGMFGPPLEGFHKGATCVTTEVTGHEEYIRDGHNALVCDWEDERGTARLLDLLARDRELLHRLRSNALQTAREWPAWDQAGQDMAEALQAIRSSPPPDPYAHAQRMVHDVQSTLAALRVQHHYTRMLEGQARKLNFIKRLPVIKQLVRLRHSRFGQFLVALARRALGR